MKRLLFLLLGLTTLLFTACGPRYSEETAYSDEGRRVPKVAIAAYKISCPHSISWDYSEELTQNFESILSEYQDLSITSSETLVDHDRIPAESLWSGTDLNPAMFLLPHDFLILPELVGYKREPFKAKYMNRQGPEIYQSVTVKVRVIDLTNGIPRLAMQETLTIDDIVHLSQQKNDDLVADVQDPLYQNSSYAIATHKLNRKIAEQVRKNVKAAWDRRLPISHLTTLKNNNR